jgi:hypothetical protein
LSSEILLSAFFDSLGLGLVGSFGSSIGLCFGFGGLFGLFAFYLRIFGGIPRVEDLQRG